jgi:MFS family permease
MNRNDVAHGEGAWPHGRELMPGRTALFVALSASGRIRRVLGAYLLFTLVEITAWFAIVMWAYAAGGAELAGAVMVVQLVPSALLAPVLASWGDRISRGTALAAAHVTLAVFVVATLTALAVDAPAGVVVAASSGITVLAATVRPLHYSVLPTLARRADDLVSATSLSSGAEQLAFLVGPVLAGLTVQGSGPALAMAVCAVLAGTAGALCLRLRLPAVGEVATTSTLRSAWDGLAALRGDGASLSLLTIMTTGFIVGGALDVLALAFATGPLGLEQTGAGFLLSATGLGGLVGAAVASSPARHRRLVATIAASGVARGLLIAAVALTVALAPAMAFVALAGFVGAIFLVCGRTLLQRSTDDRILARVFAVQESTAQLGIALGAGLAPVLVHLLSAADAFAALGLGIAAVVSLGSLPIGVLDARSVYRPIEISLLRTVTYLDLLPAFDLERMASRGTWRDVAAGVDVVRQGDPGREFFMVDEGEVVVSVDGVERTRLGAGSSFGEIALLQQVPRTATVRAVTPVRLFVLQGPDFLAAVTGSEEGHALARRVSSDLLARDESS